MKKPMKKDKFACFQWIRDIRAEMSKDMENMTGEERVAYIHARSAEASKDWPQYTREESKELIKQYFEDPPAVGQKPLAAKKHSRKKSSSRLVKA